MTKIDIDYWLHDVEYGQIRGRIIGTLLHLMDEKYQTEKWLEDNGGYGIHVELGFAFEMIEDLNMFEYVDTNTYPHDLISVYLKTEKESEELFHLAKIMDDLYKDVFKIKSIHTDIGTDQEFLSSPYLEPLRIKAKECFKIFMENEKDNEKFCEFVLKCIEKDHRYTCDTKKTAYENIEAFVNSI